MKSATDDILYQKTLWITSHIVLLGQWVWLAAHVTTVSKTRNVYRILMEKLLVKLPLGRTRGWWED